MLQLYWWLDPVKSRVAELVEAILWTT
jgi:hypothetical protein